MVEDGVNFVAVFVENTNSCNYSFKNRSEMKKFYMIVSIAVVFAMASFALTSMSGQLKFDDKLHKVVKVTNLKGVKGEGDVLVALPDGVTAETDWVLSGNYVANSIAYSNTNDIAVAFDGNDVYVQGLVYLMPSAWIKGTMNESTVTFANGQYCGEYQVNDSTVYSIYACGSDGQALTDMVFTYDATAKTLTLSNYYIENTNATTMNFFLYASGLVLTKNIPVPEMPTDVTAEPTATTASVAWEQSGEVAVDSWNLRYRPVVDLSGTNRSWDFESAEQVDDFTLVDADGDGYGWELMTAKITANSGSGAMVSKSYENGVGALTPNNWLITPKTTLGGKVSFYACGQDASYASEVFRVYVYQGENWSSVDDFVAVSDDVTTTGEMTKYEYDLSDYNGVGYIAIRHYNITDMFYLNIDDLSIEVPNSSDAVASEWITVEDVTSPYVIDGLTPETDYEVQVQAVAEKTSAWTASTKFTTLAEQVVETGYYLVGSFNDWNQTEDGGRIAFDKENRATVELEANDEFKIITPAEDGGWTWLGGVDENNVGYFLITPELMSYSLDLVEGANFRVQEAGVYHINLVWDRGLPSHIVVTRADATAIDTVGVDKKADNKWYNLQGLMFNDAPSAPGIYIHNGQKVVKR